MKAVIKKLKINRLVFYISILNKKNYKLNDSIKAYNELNKVCFNNNCSCYCERLISNKTYDLGIVIPAYNVQKYIIKCLDSIINQKTSYKIQIIVIDDGSTDNTLSLLLKYKDKIDIIHHDNCGIANSRNKGLDKIDSKYIMFIDSDDYLEDDSIQKLLDIGFNGNFDIVEGGYNEVDKNNNVTRTVNREESNDKHNLLGFPCVKIIKSELFNNVKFPNYLFEDSIMRQIVYERTTKIKICPFNVYNYRIYNANQSLHHKLTNNRMIESLYITMQLSEDRKKFGIKLNQDYYEYILKMATLIYARIRYLDLDIIKNVFSIYSDFVIKKFKDYKTLNCSYKYLEKSLKNKNFDLYIKYCKYYMLLLNRKCKES